MHLPWAPPPSHIWLGRVPCSLSPTPRGLCPVDKWWGSPTGRSGLEHVLWGRSLLSALLTFPQPAVWGQPFSAQSVPSSPLWTAWGPPVGWACAPLSRCCAWPGGPEGGRRGGPLPGRRRRDIAYSGTTHCVGSCACALRRRVVFSRCARVRMRWRFTSLCG